MSTQNKALIFAKTPERFPIPGQDLVVKDLTFDPSASLSPNQISVEVLYLSLDPYMRGRMRDAGVKSYFPGFEHGKPVGNHGLARVLKSTSDEYKPGDVVTTFLPFQEYAVLDIENQPMNRKPEVLDVANGPEDIRHWLGALGLAGITAYSSVYEIGKPVKGETIFISSAAGAVGQIVGQLAKHDGLTVIGSVGSDEKLAFLTNELGFDGGFNYKKEKPVEALRRLAPKGIDIYYENVGGEQLEAAIEVMNSAGRIVACGMVSEYNTPADQRYGVKNLMLIVGKQITFRGFIVSNPDFGEKWGQEHRQNLVKWLRDGSFKANLSEWVGMDQAAESIVGMLKGENFGKAILKVKG